MNQVERWFADLTERQIRWGTHCSTRELEAAIAENLAMHNESRRRSSRRLRPTRSSNQSRTTVEGSMRRDSRHLGTSNLSETHS